MIGGKLLCLPTSWQIVQRFRRIQIYPWQCINSYTLNMPASSPIFTSLIEWPVQEGPDLLCAFILLLLLPGSWLSLLRFMKFQFWALYFSTTPEVVSFPIRLLFRLCIFAHSIAHSIEGLIFSLFPCDTLVALILPLH